MPTIPVNQESPSVFDPLYEQIMKRMTGGAPDISDIGGLMGSLSIAAPLVSIYKNAIERAAATKAFQESAKPLGRKVVEGANWFAKKYPRVAAHMRFNPELVESSTEGVSGMIRTPHDKVTEPMQVTFTPMGVNRPKLEIKNTIAHEATHAAQALGNKRNSDLYFIADKLVGYDNNPLEKSARQRGMSATWKKNYQAPYKTTDETLLDIQNRLSQVFKDMGISLDTGFRAGAQPTIKLRKWGADYQIPENYIDIDSLDLPQNVLDDIAKLKMGQDAYTKSITKPYTATRGLRDIATGKTPISADPNLHRIYSGAPNFPEDLKNELHNILMQRRMMDK